MITRFADSPPVSRLHHPSTPRGVRNNNPLNIELGDDWLGLVEGEDERFCTFENPVMGIRAAARVMKTYKREHHIATLKALIWRWAPPPENKPLSYLRSVCKRTGITPWRTIDLEDEHTLYLVIKAMIKHENGIMPYDARTVKRGIAACP